MSDRENKQQTYKYKSLTDYLINSIQYSLFKDTNVSSPTQEIPHILWHLEVHYHVHKSSPHALILSQINPGHALSLRSILILSSHLCLDLPSGLVPSDFATKPLYVFSFSPVHHPCPAHLIFLDWITQIIFGEEYKS
jgi:hypothetical protein